jgi:transposase-like protein
MDITEVKWPARRRRGRYSDEFKREIVKACQAPGVTTTSVALANGIIVNVLRRWVLESGQVGPVRDQHRSNSLSYFRLCCAQRVTTYAGCCG